MIKGILDNFTFSWFSKAWLTITEIWPVHLWWGISPSVHIHFICIKKLMPASILSSTRYLMWSVRFLVLVTSVTRVLYYMMTSSNRKQISALLAICAGNSPVTGEFPAQRPVMRNFDVFFDLRLNKRLSKQWWGWWFETPRAHYDVTVMSNRH